MLKMLKNNIIYYIVMIQIIMLPFLPPMDGKLNLFRIIVYVIFALFSLLVVLSYIFQKKIKIDKSFYYIIGFFVMCVISGIWGEVKGLSIFDIVRGIAPFVWLVYILILNQSLKYKEFYNLIKIVSYVALFYSIRIIAYYLYYVSGNQYERVTFHLVQATSVIPMIGTLLFLYFAIKSARISIISILLMLVCYISVILTETKSMLISLIIGIIIYLVMYLSNAYTNGKDYKKHLIVNSGITIGIVFICSIIIFNITDAGTRWRNTISINKNNTVSELDEQDGRGNNSDGGYYVNIVDEGSISPRLIEFQTSLKYWKLSPIFGQGIGFRWQADGLDYGGPVIYMHNIIAFVLMDFGIIGILYILFVVIGIFIMIVRTFKRKVCNNNYIYILFSSIIMAFIYANFFAVFRSIDFIVICSVLISMMINEFNAQKELRVNNEKTVI